MLTPVDFAALLRHQAAIFQEMSERIRDMDTSQCDPEALRQLAQFLCESVVQGKRSYARIVDALSCVPGWNVENMDTLLFQGEALSEVERSAYDLDAPPFDVSFFTDLGREE